MAYVSNTLYVNENLLARPSRIRYLKVFGNLELPIIFEILDDLLINKAHKDSLITYISSLEIITVDIVKAIIEECNIHDCPAEDFQDFFNVQKATLKLYNFYKFKSSKQVLWMENATVSNLNLLTQRKNKLLGRAFTIENSELYEDFEILKVYENGIFDIKVRFADNKEKFKVRVEEITYTHTNFKDYAF